ncbi:prealbumin-like fold domain-containing protein [Acidianus manzaensis]|uniref:Carboxypeptidase regulatory-like domain-containing protein n=1 Tax=Acidianus manzaensis TaxID=282676 RepID=A0A1W6K180_9CREN|nr:prealbumin-like fold domain-containing protein [Acidianus manzaensis]ARM76247.1 hypothetical protein B6F84_09565 [Acidianus manzaensis]
MNKKVLLIVGVVILLLTGIGVFIASSYKTTVSVSNIPTSGSTETLEVKVIMNYGPFGGTAPLSDAVVQIYNSSGFITENFTNAQGVAVFHLPAGEYKVEVTDLHYSYSINLDSSKEISINYAYLYS